MRFLRTLTVTPSMTSDWGPSLPSVTSVPVRSIRSLPLPKLGLNNSCWNAGVRWCGNRRASHFLHLTWGLIYSIAGGVQFTAGIYFMMALPIFQLGSNIWTGAWNMFSGIVTVLLCCFGQLSVKKAQGLLLMSLVVTVVNLINLVVLEVGEWRGFLSQTDRDYIEQFGLNHLMYSAYLCTTMSTVVAMVASFLGSQHTFCFLQLRAEEDSARKIGGPEGSHDSGDYTKEIVKRHDDDGLNLKTPGPKPHPSWVYRHHFTQEERTEVQRSLSLLQHARNKSSTTSAFQRVELLGPLPKLPTRDLSPQQIATISDKVDAGTMRHAIIRRHNSMYASSTRTVGPNPFQPPYKLHDVSGASEVRPIVTLQRSKTSITPGSLHYRSSSIQGIARSYSTAPQFRQYISRYRTADVPLHGTAGRYKKNKPRQHVEKIDQFCEFQAGSSFDLPNIATLQRAHSQSNSPVYDEEHNYSAVMFETEDGKTTSKSSRLVKDQENSSNENIRYQAMDMIKKDTRVHRKTSSASRSNSTNTRRYYGSWENLIERSEVRETKSNLLNSEQYGSTGSINSCTSDTEGNKVVNASVHNHLYQAAGHHLQLHAVHNTSYQTNSTLETCLESDENDLDDMADVQLYDIPRSTPNLKKSNSRVSSNGKLSLRVESFKQSRNSSGTQTDISSVSKINKNQGYIGQYKKAPNKQAPSKPVRKHKRKSSQENGEARSPSPANSSTSGYSSPSVGLQSKESSPPLSKTPSPGQSLDMIDEQKENKRPRPRNGSPSKSTDDCEERITVISITPHPINENASIKKSNLKQSNRFTETISHSHHQNQNEQNVKSDHMSTSRGSASSEIKEIKEDEIEEYQIEDIEREIHRTPNEQLSVPPSHYRNQIVSHEDSQSRKSGSRIATNGSLTLSKKNVPVRQSLPPPPPDPRDSREPKDSRDSRDNDDAKDVRDSRDLRDINEAQQDTEPDILETDTEHYNTLRRGQNRYQRIPRSNQLNQFSQFSRLPPVPERPSLENRELSPVPDIVSPTNPILSSSYYNQNNQIPSFRSSQSDLTSSNSSIPSEPQQQVIKPGTTNRRTSLKSSQRQEHASSRDSSPRKNINNPQSDQINAPSNRPVDMHNLNTGTLGRRRSRIPTPRQNNAGPNKLNRSASESDLGTESVDERLETLLHLLGGARRGPATNNNPSLPPDLVAGTPNDTLQYLSQLELVARKLKDQLMRQKQDDVRQNTRDNKNAYETPDESEC